MQKARCDQRQVDITIEIRNKQVTRHIKETNLKVTFRSVLLIYLLLKYNVLICCNIDSNKNR